VATRELLASVGYDAISMKGIAARAGVGKQTVYRWWPSKAAVVAEVALTGMIPFPEHALPSTADLRADLVAWLSRLLDAMASPDSAELVRALASAATADAGAARRLYDRFSGPDRRILIDRFRAAMVAGQVREDADLAAAADALISIQVFVMLSHDPISPARASGLLDVVMRGISATP
jgi:AcrR family transcriptional regulator